MNIKLPKFLTTITPLSKAIALILFVALPFIGFCIGFNLGANKVTTPSSYKNNRSPYLMQRMMVEQETPYRTGNDSNMMYSRSNYLKYDFVSIFIQLIVVADLTLLGLWLFKQIRKS